jgi:hypothetical protein
MRVNDLPIIMIRCLLLTIVIEIIVGIIVGVRDKKDFINILLVNVLTNPLVVSLPIYLMIRYGPKARYISLGVLEVLAVLVEGFIYHKVLKYKKINPYVLSLILNLSSYLIGEVINRFI